MKQKWILLAVLAAITPAYAATITGELYDLNLELATNVHLSIDTTPAQKMLVRDGTYSFTVEPGKYTLSAYQLNTHSLIIGSAKEELAVSTDGTFTLDLVLFPDFEGDAVFLNEIEFFDEPEPEQDQRSVVLYFFMIVGFIIAVDILLIVFLLRKRRKVQSVHGTHQSPPSQGEDGQPRTPPPHDLEHPSSDGDTSPHHTEEKQDESRLAGEGGHAQPSQEKRAEEEEREGGEREQPNESYRVEKERILQLITQEGGRITQKELRGKSSLSESRISLILAELENEKHIKKIKKGRGNIIVLRSETGVEESV